ncbi:hypothetical protein CHS0354_002502 [Potamilus streckersoni]|uniref:Uncharacterized protein n=1 Tax=Potamilus streckersoni TaxID=2493646 RepID=A0AAE0SSL9_9BIVA|nr:hypothetical protein CHS0354_002502 [Potamilus streckersoni]
MQKLQEVLVYIGMVMEMLAMLEDGCYSPYRVKLDSNNLRKTKERLRELIKDEEKENEDKDERKQMRPYNAKLEIEENNKKRKQEENTEKENKGNGKKKDKCKGYDEKMVGKKGGVELETVKRPFLWPLRILEKTSILSCLQNVYVDFCVIDLCR